MQMVGHNNESICRPHAIVDEAMHRKAADRLLRGCKRRSLQLRRRR
jgi:hypothetical protein